MHSYITRCVLALFITFLASLTACSVGDGRLDDAGKYIVYISGHYNDRACYWKDDGESITRVDLSNPVSDPYSRASAITVYNGDVYVSGYYTGGNPNACFWKNGQITTMTLGSTNTLFVTEGRVLIGGYKSGYACYWDNGIYVLVDAAMNTSINSIFLENNNVHMTKTYVGNGIYFYTNGSLSGPLINSSSYSNMSRTWFYGGIRYTAGITNMASNWIAYWVGDNGPNILTNNSNTSAALPFGLHVYKGDVYVAKEEYNQACYWINNAAGKVLLPAPGNSRATAIRVTGGTIFASGSYVTVSTIPCYWRDEKRIDLDAPSAAADTTGVFVAPR